jgi:integrase/recombinase XerD
MDELQRSDRELVHLWLQRVARRSSDSLKCYVESFIRFRKAIENKTLSEISVADVAAWQTQMCERLSPASVNRHMGAISGLYKLGNAAGNLRSNPAAAVGMLKVDDTTSRRLLSEHDVLKMIDAAKNKRDHLIIRLLYAGGLRASELCDLRWRQAHAIGDAGMIVVVGKGQKVRSVRLSPATWAEMDDRKLADPDSYVFQSAGREQLARQNIFEIVQLAAIRAGVDVKVSPHMLRHAHATHALARGAPLHLVQATLGHASLKTTGRYVHAQPTESSGLYLAV